MKFKNYNKYSVECIKLINFLCIRIQNSLIYHVYNNNNKTIHTVS